MTPLYKGDRLVAKNGEDSLLVLEDCKDEKGQHALCRYDDGEYGLLWIGFLSRYYDKQEKAS